MKLMHVGDLHLGRSLGDFDLIEDQQYMLDQLLAIADEQAVDALLIAGDVYDRAVPSEAATRLLDHFLSSLAGRQLPVYMVSGNHDSDDRLQFGSRLFAANHIHISARYEGRLEKRTLAAGGEEADIYLLPFVKASQVRHALPDADIKTYEDAVRAILAGADIDESRINVLVAHQFVAGKQGDPELSGSEGLSAQCVGTVEKIGYDCFDCFDYVALGHIHSPQRVGRDAVRYAGSPLKYSLSEAHNEKSVPIVTLDGKGAVRIERLPLKPLRDVRHLRGELKDLLGRPGLAAPEDYIYATLTDEDFVSDAMGIFRLTYPNTVKIDYDNSHTRRVGQADISPITGKWSFTDLIGDFYRQMYGCEISEEEMAVMRSAAGEAGVLYETD